MLSGSVKKKLAASRPPKEESIGRSIYFLYRYIAVWGDTHWPKLEELNLRPSHIHLLATIGLDGVSNSGLARRAKVSKQAMSKLVKEMLKYGLIEIDPNEHDSRCNIISLTVKGAGLLTKIWVVNQLLRAEFDARIGKTKSKRLLALMAELVDSLDTEIPHAEMPAD